MGSFKTAWWADLLNASVGRPTTLFTTTPLSHIYVGLYTVSPSISTEGTEATGGGYARIDSIGSWPTATTTTVSNNVIVTLAAFSGAVSGGSTPFVAFALHTTLGPDTGHQIAWGPLVPANKTGNTGDVMSFPIGSLNVTGI